MLQTATCACDDSRAIITPVASLRNTCDNDQHRMRSRCLRGFEVIPRLETQSLALEEMAKQSHNDDGAVCDVGCNLTKTILGARVGPKVERKMERCMGHGKLYFTERSAGHDFVVYQPGRSAECFADNINNIACP